MNILLEIFGYIGTALVLLSMMMTSVVKLRIFNIIGSVISMTYSTLCGAWPVAFLNMGLIAINVYQLIRLHRKKVIFTRVQVKPDDRILKHFLTQCASDIEKSFPGFTYRPDTEAEVYMVFENVEPVGVLLGRRSGDDFFVELDYVTKKYRDCSIAKFLFAGLKDEGIGRIIADKGTEVYGQYLIRMGFMEHNGQQIKDLRHDCQVLPN